MGHSLIRDDTFEGYHFPAGTIVTWNHWAICTDPKEYEQPERFWPERFLNEDLDKPVKGLLGFGAGMSFTSESSSDLIVLCCGITDLLNFKAGGCVLGGSSAAKACFSPSPASYTVSTFYLSLENRFLPENRCRYPWMGRLLRSKSEFEVPPTRS